MKIKCPHCEKEFEIEVIRRTFINRIPKKLPILYEGKQPLSKSKTLSKFKTINDRNKAQEKVIMFK